MELLEKATSHSVVLFDIDFQVAKITDRFYQEGCNISFGGDLCHKFLSKHVCFIGLEINGEYHQQAVGMSF